MKLKEKLHDLYWRTFPYYIYRVYKAYKRGEAVPVPHGLKIRTIKRYASENGLVVLIETGTYRGDTISATQHLFDYVHSIELSPVLAAAARERFAGISKITIHEGDSGALLAQTVASLDRPALFWLDAHYSSGITARGILDSPIVQELNAVFNSPIQGHVILIDDAREFTGRGGYPTIDDLHNFVLAAKPSWRVLAYNDIIRIWDSAVSKA